MSKVAAFAVLGLAGSLAITQVKWRNDRQTYNKLVLSHRTLVDNSQFLQTGDLLSDKPFLLRRGDDTISLMRALAGKSRIVYLSKKGCPGCDWFEAQMDSINSNWRKDFITVSATASPDSNTNEYILWRSGLKTVPGVPVMLVVDSTGLVRQSVLGIKRMLSVLETTSVPSPTVAQLLATRIDTTSAVKPAQGAKLLRPLD